MYQYGTGYCSSGYYAGHDGVGTANADACKQVCLDDDRCYFAAYVNNGKRLSCSRYWNKHCHLLTGNQFQKDHVTFYKGLFELRQLAIQEDNYYRLTSFKKVQLIETGCYLYGQE